MDLASVKKLLENIGSPISGIEEKLGMPQGTLAKVLSGKRNLPKPWAIKLKDFVERKGYLMVKRKSRKSVVNDLTKQSVGTTQDFTTPPPKTNFIIDTTKKDKTEIPDPKKDRAAWAKWMRENR